MGPMETIVICAAALWIVILIVWSCLADDKIDAIKNEVDELKLLVDKINKGFNRR